MTFGVGFGFGFGFGFGLFWLVLLVCWFVGLLVCLFVIVVVLLLLGPLENSISFFFP